MATTLETLLERGLEEMDRQELVDRSAALAQVERQVKMVLASDWRSDLAKDDPRRSVTFSWNPGPPHGRDSLVVCRPGHAVIQPLWRAQVWLGPFGMMVDYASATDEKMKKRIRAAYATEKMRLLNRYDYPRGDGRGYNPDMKPSGPHRFPDFTVTILGVEEGTDSPPIRLHKIYEIGEFDSAYPLDSFGPRESPDAIKAHYEAELVRQSAKHEEELRAVRLQQAEILGMLKAGGGKPSASVSAGAK